MSNKYTGRVREFVSNYARESSRDIGIGVAGFLTSMGIVIGSATYENYVASFIAAVGVGAGTALMAEGAQKMDTLEWGVTHTSDRKLKNLVLGVNSNGRNKL